MKFEKRNKIFKENVKRVLDEVGGKSVDELIEQGRSNSATVLAGGTVRAAPAAPAAEERKLRKKNLNPN
ncbi:hypothetical protein WA026_006999 [Henosepilachna vigintioctopunctata]|uniref:Uncharacterized protein n=1 Tax=Henosepilachna vigintioctopunctata TaxID=420089 RepID=A0AAW1VC87_9CUCU